MPRFRDVINSLQRLTWGDNGFSLFAAGVVLFALLVASYSGRRFWIALASTLVSMAALVGFLFVAMAKRAEPMRTGLAWLGAKLQLVLDQQAADQINRAIERISAAVAANARPTRRSLPPHLSMPSRSSRLRLLPHARRDRLPATQWRAQRMPRA